MAATGINLDRAVPANLEAEKSVLGGILLDNDVYPQAAEILRIEDFYLDAHRRIYARMMDLNEAARPIDSLLLVEELRKNREIEAVGGVTYIFSLTEGLPRRENIQFHVKLVREKSLLRQLIHACEASISQALDDSDTTDEILDSSESRIFEVSERRVGRALLNVKEVAKESGFNLDDLYKQGVQITGLRTHFSDVDEKTMGLQKGDLVIIAGRPSMGKTAFAINIAENAAVRDDKVVAIFSLEMANIALLTRMLCSQARVDSHKLRSGFLAKEDFQRIGGAYASLADSKIFIDDTPGISLHEMRAKARRLFQSQKALDLIIVDYLQLMSPSGGIGSKKYENRTQEVSAMSRGLKALAKEMRVPVVALSQLSRAPESRGGDHRPLLSDLRESGSIEQDADVVMFLFREEYYMKHEEAEAQGLDGIAEVIIAKQRNGPTGTVKLAFSKPFTRFDTKADEPFEPSA